MTKVSNAQIYDQKDHALRKKRSQFVTNTADFIAVIITPNMCKFDRPLQDNHVKSHAATMNKNSQKLQRFQNNLLSKLIGNMVTEYNLPMVIIHSLYEK